MRWPLDTEAQISGITKGELRSEITVIAVPATVEGRNMTGNDYAVTAGWGYYGPGQAIMPGQGSVTQREYTPSERLALGDALHSLGDSTFDIYLNERAFWQNVPASAWNYKLGGYQVLKKWLSYREQAILDRSLNPEEVHHFTETARRIVAILLLAYGGSPWRNEQ